VLLFRSAIRDCRYDFLLCRERCLPSMQGNFTADFVVWLRPLLWTAQYTLADAVAAPTGTYHHPYIVEVPLEGQIAEIPCGLQENAENEEDRNHAIKSVQQGSLDPEVCWMLIQAPRNEC
jgi:hypothetical protein